MKYADDLVLLAREGTVLQDMIDRLIEIGIYYGLEISMVKKTEVKRFPRQPSPIQIMVGQNHLQNVEYFYCFGSVTTTAANGAREIKSRIALKKQHSTRRRLFYHLTGLIFKKQTNEALHLALSFARCCNLNTSKLRS